MRSLIVGMQIARPYNIVIAALATWVIAMLSNGPHWMTTAKIVSPTVMATGIFGASIFHFGAANAMYARKNEILLVSHPWHLRILKALGIFSMSIAVVLTFKYLNYTCQWIVAIDAIIIVLYAKVLSRYWLTKNSLIALVCISPILLGWFAGHRLHPSVPYGISITFFAYLAREVVKDIQDKMANEGFRLTLPIWLGIIPARRIAGSVMIVSIIALGFLGNVLQDYQWYVIVAYIITAIAYSRVAYSLFINPPGNEAKESKQIMIGSCYLMVTFFLLIF